MSEQSLKEFLAKVAQDEELARKVQEAGTDVVQIIRLGEENSCEFTTEDLKTVHDEMGKQIGEDLQRFLGMVSTDEELARKLEESGTDVDDIIRLGKENGCTFTADDLMAIQSMTVMNDVELNDEDLEKVAGGIVTMGALLAVAVAGVIGIIGAAAGAGYAAGHAMGKGGK